MVVLFSCAFSGIAQVDITWNPNKESVFKLAKEQDQFILLLSGRSSCGITQRISDLFTTNYYQTMNGSNKMEGPLKSIIDSNYSTWFSNYSNADSRAEISVYTAEILKEAETLPLVFIINPDVPNKVVKSFWGIQTVEQLKGFLTINLFAGNRLRWYDDEKTVLRLAQEQEKSIFKLEGRDTSPNSHSVMKLLNEDPLKKLLDDNFILWYCEFDPNAHIYTLAGHNPIITAPFISILHHEAPDKILEAVWGNQDLATLETILKSYPVSNEIVASENRVTISGNVLQISNRINNEQVHIFTIAGQCIANVPKNSYSIKIDASRFPKGALIVYGSSGWSEKIIKH